MNKTLKLTFAALALAAAFNAQAETRAVIETNMGNINLSLDETKAPKNRRQLRQLRPQRLLRQHRLPPRYRRLYDSRRRLYPGPYPKTTDKAVINEADNGLKNTVGTIAMARTGDPNSATSQFFINTADNTFLNFKNKTPQGYGYAVFGKVTSGMDVVRQISKTPTETRGFHQNVPVKPIIIKRITVTQ